MAQTVGLSQTSVRRIWHAHGLKPHLVRGSKLSNDKRFVDKVQVVVGLYLGPPDKAMVLSVDEKSQVQALDRTRTRSSHPRLPRPSQCPPQILRLDKIGRTNPCQSQPRASHPRNRRATESSDKLSTLVLRPRQTISLNRRCWA